MYNNPLQVILDDCERACVRGVGGVVSGELVMSPDELAVEASVKSECGAGE